ncbi:OmpA family protein [Methylobacterium sp. B1]|uniref:OmpA family protein n=1 Tax=Methylobacterium sp. B1 TaxID=91459 RepID=UPI002073536B|nr:OmpA family protein [Methylobacterium sp. B1]
MKALKPVWILLALAYAASGIPADPASAQDTVSGPAASILEAVPVSNAPLGGFPYFALPDGYQPLNPPETRAFGHFLFWTGTALHEVEGKVFLSIIGTKDGKTYASYELKKNIEAVLTQAGGLKIADSRIPASLTETLPEDIRIGMYEGLGNVYNEPAQTWVIRRPDRQIWVHFVPGSNNAAWTILETKPFLQTAALLPAEQLKQDLDTTGKAVIQVNFATDRTEILPASAPQIDAVAGLLRTNPRGGLPRQPVGLDGAPRPQPLGAPCGETVPPPRIRRGCGNLRPHRHFRIRTFSTDGAKAWPRAAPAPHPGPTRPATTPTRTPRRSRSTP